jgi:hypothetical protein
MSDPHAPPIARPTGASFALPGSTNIWPPSDQVTLGSRLTSPDRPAGSRWPVAPIKNFNDVPALWSNPVTQPPGVTPQPAAPPTINTPGPGGWGGRAPLRGPRLEVRPPVGPPMPSVMPNDRTFTGAPIWNPNLPDDAPLPPSPAIPIEPTGTHPITGAPVRDPGGSMTVGSAGEVGPGGRVGSGAPAYSYPWLTPAAEGHPAAPGGTLQPPARPPGFAGGGGPQGAMSQGGPIRATPEPEPPPPEPPPGPGGGDGDGE